MEPKFAEGDLIFVDPHAVPAHKKFFVVRANDSLEATVQFRRTGRDDRGAGRAWPERLGKLGRQINQLTAR